MDDDRRPGGAFGIEAATSFRLRAALILLSTAFALIGCFSADFTSYDDPVHVAEAELPPGATILKFFIPKTTFTYLPVTLVSYKIDKWLHSWWSEKLFHSWAPAVRLDTALLHGCAALFLWRLLVRLRIPETRAFFIALLFACHPLACETICWVSERKNSVSSFFGFSAIWIQTRAFMAPAESTRPAAFAERWRIPGVCLFYALALMGKPTALGLLPVFLLLETAVVFPQVRSRLTGKSAASNAAPAKPLASYLGMATLVLIALACLRINISAHGSELSIPPGGSIFTALLTDLQIFSRYFYNLVCPVELSSSYYVDALRSLSDTRVWYYGGILASLIAFTIYFARNRWFCAFGWFWFFSALATNANIIAIIFWMQDRYVYLSTPGFLIAASECLAGLGQRLGDTRQRRMLGIAFGSIVAAVFMGISASRGFVWQSTFKLNRDATEKQPLSFFAHFSLSCTLYPPGSLMKPGTPEYAAVHRAWQKELYTALYNCPDSERFNVKQAVAEELGKDAYGRGDADAAEKYFNVGITKLSLAQDFAQPHGICLAYLSLLDLYRKRDPEVALAKARESFRLCRSDEARYALGRALVACAERTPQERPAQLAEAQTWLNEISQNTPIRQDAELVLRQIDKILSDKPAQIK